ncbi:DUF4097 domain-containing protein [Microbacterium oleivorans]|uniref:DUF4097 domain-containing protein n=1 Tax=Microbacterium oleivorans TaxID=273677 RepID=UPI0020409E67|nr:DUF4097 domain-containing protein [Microbacterium oleivorans]MCM3695524.1 DUF4097 domain-containing protein [Microbacterium oleivorans]
MSIDLTPPPTAAPPAGPQPPRQTRPSAQIVAIIAICLGGLLLLGALLSGIGSIAYAASRGSDGGTADTSGVEALSLDVSAGHVVVQYADVDGAILEVAGGDGNWRLERRGDTLAVTNNRPWWALQGGFSWNDNRATLTLPAEMAEQKLEADFDVAAGSLTADGTYGRLDLHVGAGDADVSGSADDLRVDVSAGEADVRIDGAQQASMTIGAGQIIADVTGTSLDSVRVDVSAGTLVGTLPDGTYDVTSEVSAGSFDNQLETADGAARTVDVQVSAGSVTLRPAD